MADNGVRYSLPPSYFDVSHGGRKYNPQTKEARDLLRGFFDPKDWESLRSAIAMERSGQNMRGSGDPTGSPLMAWKDMSSRVRGPLMGEDLGFVDAMLIYMLGNEDSYKEKLKREALEPELEGTGFVAGGSNVGDSRTRRVPGS